MKNVKLCSVDVLLLFTILRFVVQESQVTMECIIPQKFHRTVMGAKGMKVQEITREFDVGIKFPDRPSEAESKLDLVLKSKEIQSTQLIIAFVNHILNCFPSIRTGRYCCQRRCQQR